MIRFAVAVAVAAGTTSGGRGARVVGRMPGGDPAAGAGWWPSGGQDGRSASSGLGWGEEVSDGRRAAERVTAWAAPPGSAMTRRRLQEQHAELPIATASSGNVWRHASNHEAPRAQEPDGPLPKAGHSAGSSGSAA